MNGAGGSFLGRTLLVSAAALGMLFGALVLAEQQDRNDGFEVVSIRKSGPQTTPIGGRGGGGGSGPPCIGLPEIDPGRIIFNNQTLYTLIAHAYGILCFDVSTAIAVPAGLDWIKSERWVVQALAPQGTQFDNSKPVAPFRPIVDLRLRTMLQKLLADRFSLVIHRETKEVAVYALTVAKSGSKLQHPENVPCTVAVDGRYAPLRPGQKPYCSFVAFNSTVLDFARSIRLSLDRPVVDNTGLSGSFEFRMLFSDPNRPSDDPSGPSIFTAMEEQLGLKLEATKGPMETVVVDHAERPSEN